MRMVVILVLRLVMFWNVENMFDTRPDNGGEDFSYKGEHVWTSKRFGRKCDAIAKTILASSDRYGQMPDIIGLAELENAYVLKRIAGAAALKKYGYGCVHFESADPRGIDVGLLNRKKTMKLTAAMAYRVVSEKGDTIATRDILCACFDDSLAVLVNHHPSKYGGAKESSPKRASAIRTMMEIIDSLRLAGYSKIISMGDFNAPGDDENFNGVTLRNESLKLMREGRGTIKYDGKWELIDMFFTEGLQGDMTIFDFPPLLCRDSTHSGEKPFRTWSGPRYNGGVSDHLPIFFKIITIFEDSDE